MIRELGITDDGGFKENDALKKKLDKYDVWFLEGSPSADKGNLQYEVYFETGYFILDEENNKLYDANEYYRALYKNNLGSLKEVAVIDIKREDFFKLIKITYE